MGLNPVFKEINRLRNGIRMVTSCKDHTYMSIQDVGDIRTMGHPLRRVAHVEWNELKRKKKVAINKVKEVGDLKCSLTSNLKMQSLMLNLHLVQSISYCLQAKI